MTTMSPKQKQCFYCGYESKYWVLMSSNTFGREGPDLDGRPPEMMRSAIQRIDVCPFCGYVADDISSEDALDKADIKIVMASREYRECKPFTFTDALAQEFYRRYLLDNENGDISACYCDLRSCAWACDDVQDKENAKQVRQLMLPLVAHLLREKKKKIELQAYPSENKEKEEEEKGQLRMQFLDCLRRAGNFNEIIREFDDGQGSPFLQYEVALAKEADATSHSFYDAYEWGVAAGLIEKD